MQTQPLVDLPARKNRKGSIELTIASRIPSAARNTTIGGGDENRARRASPPRRSHNRARPARPSSASVIPGFGWFWPPPRWAEVGCSQPSVAITTGRPPLCLRPLLPAGRRHHHLGIRALSLLPLVPGRRCRGLYCFPPAQRSRFLPLSKSPPMSTVLATFCVARSRRPSWSPAELRFRAARPFTSARSPSNLPSRPAAPPSCAWRSTTSAPMATRACFAAPALTSRFPPGTRPASRREPRSSSN